MRKWQQAEEAFAQWEGAERALEQIDQKPRNRLGIVVVMQLVQVRFHGTPPEQSVARRCFLVDGTKLVMPAYGALTGGLDVRNPAIHKALRAPITALVPSGGRLLRFPVAEGRA